MVNLFIDFFLYVIIEISVHSGLRNLFLNTVDLVVVAVVVDNGGGKWKSLKWTTKIIAAVDVSNYTAKQTK